MADESYENLMKPAHERFSIFYGNEGNVNQHNGEGADISDPQSSSLVVAAHGEANRLLRTAILGRISVNTPEFFEHLIIDVLLRMGYGNRHRDLARCLGRSHDGGIDGIVSQDELGLDLIYLQAKRLRPGTTVPISHVRDFVGSMEAKHAAKGVLISTAQFTPQAHSFVAAVSRSVALVSGEQLADIMIRHNIGVSVRETYQFKELEPGYFRSLAETVAGKLNPSTGMSPSC